MWVWLKIKQEGLRRFWSMFPLNRVPFWYRFLEPQPCVVLYEQLTLIFACVSSEDTVFQVVEHSFCTYFFLEILIRFGAFAQKRRALVDPWFMFDAVLVLNMVVETWFVPIIILAAGSGGSDFVNISFLRMMRSLVWNMYAWNPMGDDRRSEAW